MGLLVTVIRTNMCFVLILSELIARCALIQVLIWLSRDTNTIGNKLVYMKKVLPATCRVRVQAIQSVTDNTGVLNYVAHITARPVSSDRCINQ